MQDRSVICNVTVTKFAVAKIMLLPIVLVIVALISCTIGSYPVPIETVINIIAAKFVDIPPIWTPDMEIIMWKIRLPRILAAMLVGAALSAAGAAYQGLFKNPMVSPGILGVSAGASFGAAIAILFSFNMIGIQMSAFVGGMLAVSITYLIGITLGKNGDATLIMILAGIIVGTLFTSFVSLAKYVADPYTKLPTITYWLMGSLASVNMPDVLIAGIPIVIGLIVLTLIRWNLNVMSFGDEEAKTLGINTEIIRLVVIFCATLISSSAVAISGIIGLVGLIVPHLARLIVGPNYNVLLPMSIGMGSLFLLLVDDLARTMYTVEIPLGILTSMIGAPIFLFLLISNRRKQWA